MKYNKSKHESVQCDGGLILKWTGRGGGRPPREKIVVENWCYLPWIYTFEEEAEIQKDLVKIMKKVNFP